MKRDFDAFGALIEAHKVLDGSSTLGAIDAAKKFSRAMVVYCGEVEARLEKLEAEQGHEQAR